MARRRDDRKAPELRPINIRTGVQSHASGSVLIEWGGTHVLCSAQIEDRVPHHRLSSGGGWLTAEYAMLPGSTTPRARRERPNPSGRSAEIQRLIGRSLRAAIDLKKLKSRTIWVDCDVLQADGGTRCASVTGGFIATYLALRTLKSPELLRSVRPVAAVSTGVYGDEILADLDYSEDSQADVDLNVVMAIDGIIEVQGTAEKRPFNRVQLDTMLDYATAACRQLFDLQEGALGGFDR